MTSVIRNLVTICVLLALFSCSLENSSEMVTLSPTGYVPPSPQRPGDPLKGYALLLNYPYISCGIPAQAYQKFAEQSENPDVISGRNEKNQDLPYFYTAYQDANGNEVITSNCLTCHAARFNDELVIGLGNESLDFTRDLTTNAERAGAFVVGEKQAQVWKKWADRIATIAPYIQASTVGVNPANNMTFILMAHHNPDSLSWSADPLIEPPPKQPLPVSVPPWWRMKKKHSMFYDSSGRGDHARVMMLAATLCTDSNDEAQQIDRQFVHIRAYLESIEAPRYPFEIDRGKAEIGKDVFNDYCVRCHGSYGDDWYYPNLVIPIVEIGTDPEIVNFTTGGAGERFIRWFESSFYGELSDIAPAPGYVAPPLDGIWATAPFLHNGSVPDIATVLNSSERPKFWKRDLSQNEFNQENLGWNFIALEYGKSDEMNPTQKKWVYDTTEVGYSNQGHTFGDVLTKEQRIAILEYLKTL